MPESLDVRIYKVQKVDRPKPYFLRWKVGSVTFSKTYKYQAQADTQRSKLIAAARSGEPFDTETGEPVSWARTTVEVEKTWYEFALSYLDMKWPHVAPNTRTGIAEALAVLTMALVTNKPGRPNDKVLRAALYGWAFNSTARKQSPKATVRAALEWVEGASVPLRSLQKSATARLGLEAISRKTDGKSAKASTFTRKRATYYNALEYAVELELLDFNPLERVKWTLPKKDETVDPRVAANPAQVRQILAEVRKLRPEFAAFFACLYFAAMRPAEVVNLTESQCYLPERGWGRLDLSETATRAGRAWTDSGEAHDVRGLKHRAADDMRPVPIPPELVRLLRQHLADHGTAADGRLFRGKRHEGFLSESTYGPIWKRARTAALTEAKAASKLAERPYDLRHGGVSLWLNSGVPATEVARRAGHSVEVLLRVYAKCIDGQHDALNQRIEDALADGSAGEPEPSEGASDGEDLNPT